MQDPFFIIGAPRSGTTFLQTVLDRHPDIFITNETRVMTFASRTLNKAASWLTCAPRSRA